MGRRGRCDPIRPGLDRRGRGGRRSRRPDRPDARSGPAGQRRHCPSAGHPVERPAHRARLRRDPRGGRSGAAHRDHRQRCPDRVHRAEARLGARPRAARLGPDRAHPAAEGLRAPATHRWIRPRQGRRRRHAAVRPRGARLVGRGPRGPADRSGLAAGDVRGPRGHRGHHGGGGRSDRTAGGDAGRGRRRGPVHQRGRRRCRRPGRRRLVARDLRRGVRDDRPTPAGSSRPGPCVLPCGPGTLAHDDRDAVGGRQPALVPRRPGSRRRLRRSRGCGR